MLKASEQRAAYGILDPFDGLPSFFNEYLYMWKVCPEQIVCTWSWTEVEEMIAQNWCFEEWYTKVLKIYYAHEIARNSGGKVVDNFGCHCCGHKTEKFERTE